jgi:hypothetical protein
LALPFIKVGSNFAGLQATLLIYLVFYLCSCYVPSANTSKEGVMKSVISATIVCFVISSGAAFAQAPAAATAPLAAPAEAAPPPATTKTAKPKLSSDEKKKVSQDCSAQANDKNLHGKDRRTFRAGCIKRAGVAAARARPGGNG